MNCENCPYLITLYSIAEGVHHRVCDMTGKNMKKGVVKPEWCPRHRRKKTADTAMSTAKE